MTNTESIAQLRLKITALRHERAALQAQKKSRREVRAAVDEDVSSWKREAEETARRNLQLLARDGHANLLAARISDGTSSVYSRANLGPLLVALVGEKAVAKFLLADIDGISEGLDKAAKAARLEAIESELFDLETQEERLVEQCEEEGIPVQRRADARPEIVLGVLDPVVPQPYESQYVSQYQSAAQRVADSPYLGRIANANRK